MKRILVTILSILYLASAMGATVEMHYCMGKSIGANFVHKDDGTCRKCGMKNSLTKGCCKNEHKTFKTSDHQLAKASVYLPVTSIEYIPVSYGSFCYTPVHVKPSLNEYLIYSPPNTRQGCPIYIQYRNLRI